MNTSIAVRHNVAASVKPLPKMWKLKMLRFKDFVTKPVVEGSETWEAGYKRRVVKTTKPEHKEKGLNWRIKGKERDEISIKLYKSKPDFNEFKKQMKRVAGHEFGA